MPFYRFIVNKNVEEYQRVNQNWTIQRNWQHKQGEEKQNKNTRQYMLDPTIDKQTQIM